MKKLNKKFKLSDQDKEILNNLPDNMPDIKLTKKQIDQVRNLYFKYIRRNIDNIDWSIDLDKMERREKWPSGPRVKQHESQRFVLSHIQTVNEWGDLTDKQASDHFLNILKGIRTSFQIVVYYSYIK